MGISENLCVTPARWYIFRERGITFVNISSMDI